MTTPGESKVLNRRLMLSGLLAIAAAAPATQAQTVTRRVLIDNNADIRAVSLPSLHNGIYAGFGSRTSDFRSVIYGGRLSDPAGTPATLICATGETVPNRPDRTFGFLRIPTVWNGLAYFSAGASASSPPDGLYARGLDGGPLNVVADRFNGFGPWIDGPFAGAAGLVYVNPSVSAGTGAGISLWTYGQQYIPIAQYFEPSPEGAFYQSTTNSYVAIGGNKVAFSIRCTHIGADAGYGTYVHNLDTGSTTMIANWNTPIPGDGRLVALTTSVDTDGEQVVFAVGNGNPYFGGIAAICLANVDGTGLRTIVRNGDPVPGIPGKTFRNVGRSAVDGDVVYFQGIYVDGSSERTSLFAHINGVNIPVLLFTDELGGVTGLTPWMDPRGMDGPDLVVECEYVTPESPFLQKFMLVHVNISTGQTCYADCDGVGGLTGNDFQCFLNAFVSGASYANCDGVGGLTGNDFQCFLDKYVAGCP